MSRDKKVSDPVDHPAYYCQGIECIDYVLSHEMDFCEGAIVKYITRWRHKHPAIEGQIEDLKKAQFYLSRLIKQAEEEQNG